MRDLELILEQLTHVQMLTDSKSLFNKITKWNSMSKKGLFIDVKEVREAYENIEVSHVDFLESENDNLACISLYCAVNIWQTKSMSWIKILSVQKMPQKAYQTVLLNRHIKLEQPPMMETWKIGKRQRKTNAKTRKQTNDFKGSFGGIEMPHCAS